MLEYTKLLIKLIYFITALSSNHKLIFLMDLNSIFDSHSFK